MGVVKQAQEPSLEGIVHRSAKPATKVAAWAGVGAALLGLVAAAINTLRNG